MLQRGNGETCKFKCVSPSPMCPPSNVKHLPLSQLGNKFLPFENVDMRRTPALMFADNVWSCELTLQRPSRERVGDTILPSEV